MFSFESGSVMFSCLNTLAMIQDKAKLFRDSFSQKWFHILSPHNTLKNMQLHLLWNKLISLCHGFWDLLHCISVASCFYTSTPVKAVITPKNHLRAIQETQFGEF